MTSLNINVNELTVASLLIVTHGGDRNRVDPQIDVCIVYNIYKYTRLENFARPGMYLS